MTVTLRTVMSWRDVASVADGAPLSLAPAVRERIAYASRIVERIVETGVRAYGVNTGVGALSDTVVDHNSQSRLSRNIILSHACGVGELLAPREVRRAIATSDYPTLIRVPGIGRKGAEKIVIELRDRIGAIDGSDVPLESGVTPVALWRDQLRQALAGLGFTGKEAGDAIDLVAAYAGDSPDVSLMLRRSIQLLGRTR